MHDGVLELRLRLWTPACGGYHHGGYTVEVRVRVTEGKDYSRVRVALWEMVRAKVRIRLRSGG